MDQNEPFLLFTYLFIVIVICLGEVETFKTMKKDGQKIWSMEWMLTIGLKNSICPLEKGVHFAIYVYVYIFDK